MKKIVFYIALCLWLTLPSCFTEEEPIASLDPTEATISTYRPENGQVFYSLKEQKIVKEVGIREWDLAFSCSPDDYTIKLNSSRGMGVFNTTSNDFYGTYKEGDYPWVFDRPSGQKDFSAIGDWGDFSFENPQSYGDVYLINMGVDLNGYPTNVVKMKIRNFDANTYNIVIGDLDGNYERQFLIEKNDSFNYQYLSLTTESLVSVEPPKKEWDLLFTSYVKHKIPTSSPLFFSVTNELEITDGVLINPYQHEVTSSSEVTFDDLNFFDAEGYTFNDTMDYIGRSWFDWTGWVKYFIVNENNTFVIRDFDQNYYAVQFESFNKKASTRYDIRFILKSL